MTIMAMLIATTGFHTAFIQSRGVKLGRIYRVMKANATTDCALPIWVSVPPVAYPAICAAAKIKSRWLPMMALEAKSKDIGLYTIGLGDEVKGDFLAQLSTSPEYYYKAASGAELGAIYQQIATAICKKGPSVIEIISRMSTMELPTE